MIERYRDHAANERTYLAWIRTAITILAFGILVEKIDLFFLYIGKHIGYEDLFQPSLSAEIVGLGLFLCGIVIIIIATVRFFMHQKGIESEASIPFHNRLISIIFSGLMIIFTVVLFSLLIIKIFP